MTVNATTWRLELVIPHLRARLAMEGAAEAVAISMVGSFLQQEPAPHRQIPMEIIHEAGQALCRAIDEGRDGIIQEHHFTLRWKRITTEEKTA